MAPPHREPFDATERESVDVAGPVAVSERGPFDLPELVGMVHLPPLPGAPRYGRDDHGREEIRDAALADALALVENGFDGVLVENFGDAPFFPDEVPRHVVAELTAAVRECVAALDAPVGVNVLRNDARAALSVAAAAGGSFVRVNVHTGVSVADQGLLEGRAHGTLRLRERLDAPVGVLADVGVKHATPLGGRELRAVALETIDRGLADGLVVSGPATGESVREAHLKEALDARDDATRDVPVFLGSGVTPGDVDLLELADGAVVGTALKRDGRTESRVDPERVREFVDAVR